MAKQKELVLEQQRLATKIMAQLEAKAPKVLANYPVEIAYLHGSVARGQASANHDIDIALVLSELLAPYERLRLESEIQTALEEVCDLPNLDVRTINHAPITLQGVIILEGILLYDRVKDRRIAFEVLTRQKFTDYQLGTRELP